MTQASNSALGEIQLAGDLAGSNSATAPALTATGVTAGSYTVPTLTIDAKGRVTSATSGTLTNATTSVKGIVQVGSNIDVSAGVISVATATTAVKGILQVTNGSGLSLTSGTLSLNLANGTGTPGVVFQGSSGLVTIVNGAVDLVSGLSGSVLLNAQNTFTKSQATALVTITDAATITPDLSLSNVQKVTLAGNRTFAAPTNAVVGGEYTLVISQDATGTRTGTFNAAYKFRSGQSTTLTTTASKTDIVTMVCIASGSFLCDIIKGF